MSYDSLKTDIKIFIGVVVLASVLFFLRFTNTVNPAVDIFLGIFEGSLIIILKNVVIKFKYKEHQRMGVEKSLMIFSAVALFSLILTCILATVL